MDTRSGALLATITIIITQTIIKVIRVDKISVKIYVKIYVVLLAIASTVVMVGLLTKGKKKPGYRLRVSIAITFTITLAIIGTVAILMRYYPEETIRYKTLLALIGVASYSILMVYGIVAGTIYMKKYR